MANSETGNDPPENEPPVADFTFSPENPRENEITHFINQSNDPDGSIEGNYWEHGDGEVSFVENPYYSYRDEGNYEVMLEVTDDDGAKDSITKTITVGSPGNEPPYVDFEFSPKTPVVKGEIQITNQSHDPDGTIVRYRWEWGDGTHDAGYEPTHSWDEFGTYDITLKVTDDNGATNTIEKPIVVIPQENQPPDVYFTFSPSHPSPYEDVKFTEKASDPDGHIMRYNWDFGDENTSTASNPTHSYDEEGSFSVSLKVTDDDGATTTWSRDVTIAAETEPTPPDGEDTTKGGNVKSGSEIKTETEEDGSWKGLDNLVPDFSGAKIERFSLGWSCPIGIGPFSIDVCAILAAPIEVPINIILDLLEFALGDLLNVIIDWALKLARDTVDAMLTFPPPLEQLSDYAIDWIIYGEDDAKINLTNELKGVVTDWTREYVSEVVPSEQELQGFVINELNQFAMDMGLDPKAKKDTLEELIWDQIYELDLTPDQLAQDTLDELISQYPALAGLLAPEEIRRASFIYRITEEWYEDHEYDPEGKPLEVHIPADLYSNFFNAIAWTPVEELPADYADWQFHPYENRVSIYSALGIDMTEFELTDYQEELFMRRSFREIQTTASKMQSMIVGWLESSVEEFQPTWQEIVTELSDLLQPPIKNTLEDMGFIVPPNLEEVEATAPEALEVLITISNWLDNIEAIEAEDIEELDDETEALIETLSTLTPEEEE